RRHVRAPRSGQKRGGEQREEREHRTSRRPSHRARRTAGSRFRARILPSCALRPRAAAPGERRRPRGDVLTRGGMDALLRTQVPSVLDVDPTGRAVDVDVIVIGGGVNGTGVARDCALRGLRVALFERNDIAFGASGNSSGMIHGGPRYLTTNPDVTYTSCLDSGHIQRIAPHLLFRIPFLMPVFGARGLATTLALTAYDAFFSLYDRYQPLKRGKNHTRLSGDELLELEPGLAGGMIGGVTFDEWGIDGARLCIANAVDAMERGAEVRVHTTVTEVLRRDDGRVYGVRFRDRRTNDSGVRTASLVVNATGAWAPLTAALGGLAPETARIRPGKGIHVFLDRRLTNYAIATNAIDGRQVFLMPWQNMSVLGTTDD